MSSNPLPANTFLAAVMISSRRGSLTVGLAGMGPLFVMARPSSSCAAQPVTDELDDEIGDVGRGDAVVDDQPPVRQLTISAATL